MHFTIQNPEEISHKGTQYIVYKIHINGSYHCSLRYSQLREFNDMLKKEFYYEQLPNFPPKKLFNLNTQQINERRLDLEKYFQLVSQITNISHSNYFRNFLLEAQKESYIGTIEDVMLDIFMPNKHKISISVKSSNHSYIVLQAVAKKINLKESFINYFALFLITQDKMGNELIVRKLEDYEAPYISLQISNALGPHSIFIRKSYWDHFFDDVLIDDRISMNILYIQTVAEIDQGLIEVTKEQQKDLCYLQNNRSKRDFLKLAKTLKFYNCFLFENCFVDYPKENTEMKISLGLYQLQFHSLIKTDAPPLEFKVTRMRCWRISTAEDLSKNNFVELSFEYLIAKDTLIWISILSTQSILISCCIQSMVDELIMKRDGITFERKNQRFKDSENSASNLNGSSKQQISKVYNSKVTISQSMTFNPLSDNEAFDGINEDDL